MNRVKIPVYNCWRCKQPYLKNCFAGVTESTEYVLQEGENHCVGCSELLKRYSLSKPHVLEIKMGISKSQTALETLLKNLIPHLGVKHQHYHKMLPGQLCSLTLDESSLLAMSLLKRNCDQTSITASTREDSIQVSFPFPGWNGLLVECPKFIETAQSLSFLLNPKKGSVTGIITIPAKTTMTATMEHKAKHYDLEITFGDRQWKLVSRSEFVGGMILGLSAGVMLNDDNKLHENTLDNFDRMGDLLKQENSLYAEQVALGNTDIMKLITLFPMTREWDSFLSGIVKTCRLFR